MVNPILTLAFDLFVIAAAGILLYATVLEHRRGQRGVVASERRFRTGRNAPVSHRAVTTAAPGRIRRKIAA
ncbi:MAG: hypothetical protein AB7T37_10380 [Dehalococcoidia bacterium]